MMLRRMLIALVVVSLPLAVAACGSWKGSKEIEEHGEGAIGKGPGLLTGKRGGIVIYQR